MPREARVNQKDYTHYVIVSQRGVPLIESGWEYAEDARTQIRGNLPRGVKAKVFTKTGAQRAGLDPDNNNNWLGGKGSAHSTFPSSKIYPEHGLDGAPSKRSRLQSLDPFTSSYIDAALWSSTDESDESGGEPIDRNYGPENLTHDALGKMIEDSEKFQRENLELLSKAGDASQNGHDFWLTRNHHGAGFWDRGYPKAIGDALTKAAHAYGEVHLYVQRGKIGIE